MNKLTAVHLVDEGVYIVERGWGYTYEVDGLPAPSGQFVVKSLDGIVRVETQVGELLNYKDDAGNTLSTADYDAMRAELRQGATEDSDLELTFPTLEAEFGYRKFIAQWKPGDRAPTVVTRTPAEVEVSEVRVNSGDPDIVSLWNSPNVHVDQRLYSLNRDGVMVRACREQCAEAGLTLDNESHPSYLRFAKIEGEYAFSDSFDQSRRAFVGTLEQCKAEKASCIQRVTDVIRVRAAKKRGLALKDAATVLLGLREVQDSLRRVRSKESTSGSLFAANKKLAALIADIEKEIPPIAQAA